MWKVWFEVCISYSVKLVVSIFLRFDINFLKNAWEFNWTVTWKNELEWDVSHIIQNVTVQWVYFLFSIIIFTLFAWTLSGNCFKDVRANCFCASLLHTRFTCHVMHQARTLTSKVKNNRENDHCYNFEWI